MTGEGCAGELHAFWNDKSIPRSGERINLNEAFSEGIFLLTATAEAQEESLKKDAKLLEKQLRGLYWEVCEVIKHGREGEVQSLIITVNQSLNDRCHCVIYPIFSMPVYQSEECPTHRQRCGGFLNVCV